MGDNARAKSPGADEILVVGAGISGLYAALLLARRGARARVIEKGSSLFGLAGAELFRGIPCDLGSHRLHPEALEMPLFREIHAARPFLTRPRRGVLLLGGQRLPYPPSGPAWLAALGLTTSLSIAAALARGARRRAFRGWEEDRAQTDEARDIGFERFVTERVGARAYQAFYRPYAEKVWGIDPRELSQLVAKKRVSTERPLALVARAAASLLGMEPEGRRIDRFVYPSRGITSITTYLEEQLAKADVPIERGRAFGPEDARGQVTLFAGDFDALTKTTLEHRGLYLVYLALPTARISAAETYYSPDPAHWFGRVSELQNYSPELKRPGETILCVEIPEGAHGKGIDFSRGERLAELLDQLARAGITPRRLGAPLEARQCFVPRVYPLYRRGFLGAFREAMREVKALGHVFPFGRQALFLHCNLDHCATIAEAVVAHVLAGNSVESWIPKAEAYLELRVRD